MSLIEEQILLRQLRWRYATQKFDAARKISDAQWHTLEQVLVLTPSSFGLQPWKFFVVTNPMLREKLVATAWKQRQVADASHLVVMSRSTRFGTDDVHRYIDRVAHVRGVAPDTLADFKKMLLGFFNNPPPGHDVKEWATRQIYIALGNFITSTSLMGIDTCPMEGFDQPAFDAVLGLTEMGFESVVLCPAGYRAADDPRAILPKVRFDHGEVITRLD